MVDQMTKEYRQKATSQRRTLFWFTVANFIMNIAVTTMFAINLVHHW